MDEDKLKAAASAYYDTFRDRDWKAWRELLTDRCWFVGPLGTVYADERLSQMQAATDHNQNLTYKIVAVEPPWVDVELNFDYKDDIGQEIDRDYLTRLLYNGDYKLVGHMLAEVGASLKEIEAASAFTNQYHQLKGVLTGHLFARSNMPSGFVFLRGVIRDIREEKGVCNLYVHDGNVRYWCRGNDTKCQVGDHVEINGLIQIRRTDVFVQVNDLRII